MKAAVICAVLILFCTASLPVLFVKDGQTKPVMTSISNIIEQKAPKNADSAESFRIKLTKSGKIKTVKRDEYIIGVLCGEISPLYSTEAIKAQAVAAYTFALRRTAAAKENGQDFDLTDSPDTCQCYTEKSEIYEKWGENADKYYKIFESAVKEVSGQTVEYDGALALTVYHAASSGVTNSSKDVWGSELPYLVSVDSVGDKLSKGYLSEVTLPEAEVREKLKEKCDLPLGKCGFEDIKVADSGRVLTARVGEKELSGGDIASLLSLKSGNFEVNYSSGNYVFTVKGRGHGVGMSQTGAEYMAKQGSSYEEILLHYYKGCTVKK